MAHDDGCHDVGRVLERVQDGPFGVAEVGVDTAWCLRALVGDQAGIGKSRESCRTPAGGAGVLVGGDALDEGADDVVEGEGAVDEQLRRSRRPVVRWAIAVRARTG